jgi:hypothetical protein
MYDLMGNINQAIGEGNKQANNVTSIIAQVKRDKMAKDTALQEQKMKFMFELEKQKREQQAQMQLEQQKAKNLKDIYGIKQESKQNSISNKEKSLPFNKGVQQLQEYANTGKELPAEPGSITKQPRPNNPQTLRDFAIERGINLEDPRVAQIFDTKNTQQEANSIVPEQYRDLYGMKQTPSMGETNIEPLPNAVRGEQPNYEPTPTATQGEQPNIVPIENAQQATPMPNVNTQNNGQYNYAQRNLKTGVPNETNNEYNYSQRNLKTKKPNPTGNDYNYSQSNLKTGKSNSQDTNYDYSQSMKPTNQNTSQESSQQAPQSTGLNQQQQDKVKAYSDAYYQKYGKRMDENVIAEKLRQAGQL